MDFRVDALGPCLKKVGVTIPPERIQEEFDRQVGEINENVALPGFRKGRAPRKLLEKRFGTLLGKEVKEKLVEAALKELIDQKKVEPLKPPEIDLEALKLEPASPLSFEFELLTRPEFETPTYKGLEVKVPVVEVGDAQVDRAIDRLRRQSANLETAEKGKVQDEDILVVDWEAKDGDSVEAHDDNAWYPYGRGVLAGFVAKDLDEQLKGKTPGAEATCEVQAQADDPREELRGRTFRLHVTLKEIKRYVLPEIDEAFLKDHDYDDVDEMREDVRKRIQRAMLRERDLLAEERLVEGLLEGIEISLPEEFVKTELEGWARRRRMQLEMESVAEEEINKKIDEARQDARTLIEKDMKRHFLLDRLAEAEDVRATETDILQAVREISQAYGRPEEEVIASFRDPGRLSELSSQIRHKKVREIMLREAKMVETVEDAEQGKKDKGKKDKAPPKKKAAKKKASKKKKAKGDDTGEEE